MITKTTKPWHAITFYFMSLRRIWLPFLHSFPSGIYKHWLDPSWVFLFSRLSHLCRDFRLIYTSVVCQLIQHVYGSLLLGSLKLDTAFQAWPDQGWEERTFIPLLPVILPQCRPWLSWWFFFFFCCEGVLQDSGQSIVYQDFETLLWQSCGDYSSPEAGHCVFTFWASWIYQFHFLARWGCHPEGISPCSFVSSASLLKVHSVPSPRSQLWLL